MNSYYMLRPGNWAGLSETPVRPGWLGSSPVLITGVKPLKTGLGQLRVDSSLCIPAAGGIGLSLRRLYKRLRRI
jgi:hypothetical protein